MMICFLIFTHHMYIWVYVIFLWGLCYLIFSFLCMFCRSLLYFFFCPLCCLFFFDIQILITPLVSSDLFCTFSFVHCVVCSSSIYRFWLPLWYLQTYFVLFLLSIVLSFLLRYTDSDYPFGVFKLFLLLI